MFQKFSGIEEVYGLEGGGEEDGRSSLIFCQKFFLVVPKNFGGEALCVSESLWCQKVYT